MNILITAIGSMSAACAIKQLKTTNTIIGCDIYPEEWHNEPKLCNYFYQAPYATDEEKYCNFLLELCNKHNIKYIIPLTDLEIDVINKHRNLFDNITICTQSYDIINIVRNKYNLYQFFEKDTNIPTLTTWKLLDYKIRYNKIILKPIYGRSSIDIRINPSFEDLNLISDKYNYIVQQYIEGNVCTIDYCRSSKYKTEVLIPREELIRTTNGAGLTVKIFNDEKLTNLVSYIGNKLDINGVVNMEFIKNNNEYYLIDFNPRFSSGIDFSLKMGYDFANNHINCFTGKPIDPQPIIEEKILVKHYTIDE